MRVAALLLLAACPRGDTDTEPVDTGDFGSTVCGTASEAWGDVVCRHRLPDAAALDAIGVPSGQPGVPVATKYLVPVGDAPLPTLFLNSRVFPLHLDFLVQAFPELYGGLTPFAYLDLIFGPNKRYLAGTLALHTGADTPFLAFTVWEDPADPATWLTYAEVRAAWLELRQAVPYAELVFEPTGAQLDRVGGWNAEFPVVGVDPDLAYEVYTAGVGFGTVRRLTVAELADASANAGFGFQDLLVLDQAPFDLERVVSGAVTGSRQAPLSHLNVRSAARGTPNCFVRDAHEELASWEGQLVRLECGAEALSVAPATLAEAQAFWDALRPDPVAVPEPDRLWTGLDGLLVIPTATEADRSAAVARFGSKATNLAVLYQRIDPALHLRGFAIPMHFYEDFLEANTWVTDLGAGPQTVSFRDTIDVWLADPAFHADAALRRQRLVALQAAMEGGQVDPLLLQALAPRITEVFGSTTRTVRFRSSSNAEDALGFSGAGLYTSASGCLADDLDGDAVGPSWCDPDRASERPVSAALTEVWASLWGVGAWEERAWYGIPMGSVSMGVLANDRSEGEAANIVAFTGDPVGGTELWLVNAQAGEGSVVSPDPNEVPESSYIELTDGQVTRIVRVSASSEVDPGVSVLDDATLQALGAALWTIRDVFPLDEVPPAGHRVLLDTEWKVLVDGRLIVKQVRPFLASD